MKLCVVNKNNLTIYKVKGKSLGKFVKKNKYCYYLTKIDLDIIYFVTKIM